MNCMSKSKAKAKCCEHCSETTRELKYLKNEVEKLNRSSSKLSHCEQVAGKCKNESEDFRQRMSSVERNYRRRLEEMSSKLNQWEQEAEKYKNESEYFRQRISNMELKHKKELEETRSILKHVKEEAEKNKNEYADFKQRMKYEVSRELERGGARSENIMNPCRESELLQMYERMKTQSWRETKDRLLRHGVPIQGVHEHTVKLIKMTFENATQYVNTVINGLIEKACRVQYKTVSKPASLQKIIHAFQIFFCNSDDDYYKQIVQGFVSQHCNDHREICIDLAAECYKVATLMALHDPPLMPVWNEKQGHFELWPNTTNTQTGSFPAIH